jgi:hypothetical protein
MEISIFTAAKERQKRRSKLTSISLKASIEAKDFCSTEVLQSKAQALDLPQRHKIEVRYQQMA